ncbi:toxin of the YpjF-YfjZ toxin-antitoxin system [Klebsiella pneumoniae]|uniref:Toxin of the YpjF-YfjZ toxin-antitoxin system n=1 Tax=Klebsiella pneumoniae TaxID=573 RepID=A0A2X3D8F3_KLEPN|nr:toxin of the YpjF-YfjZ toxin-antitoxin system [Klebsiella pneumoniae]
MTEEQHHWQTVAGALLSRHYGLTLNDTALCEEVCVITLQEAGLRPYEAINDLAEKFDLERIDVNDYQQLSPALRLVHELRVLRELSGH